MAIAPTSKLNKFSILIIVAAIENHKDTEIDLLCKKYLQRIEKIHPIKLELIAAARNKDSVVQKEKESAAIEKLCKPHDQLFLCDERGKNYRSLEFAQTIEKDMANSRGKLIFAIGGAYGFTDELLRKYPKIRLSDFTFPHHLARLVLVEQLYRALSIMKGSGYHHE